MRLTPISLTGSGVAERAHSQLAAALHLAPLALEANTKNRRQARALRSRFVECQYRIPTRRCYKTSEECIHVLTQLSGLFDSETATFQKAMQAMGLKLGKVGLCWLRIVFRSSGCN